MKLKQYIKDERLTYAEFGNMIGTPYPRTVQRYAEGLRIPKPDVMAKITIVTNGKVTPNDFYT